MNDAQIVGLVVIGVIELFCLIMAVREYVGG